MIEFEPDKKMKLRNLLHIRENNVHIIGSLRPPFLYRVSDIMTEFLQLCDGKGIEESLYILKEKYPASEFAEFQQRLIKIKDKLFVDDEYKDYTEIDLSRKVSTLTLNVTRKCNLKCSYCFENDEYRKLGNMPFIIAKKAIDTFFTDKNSNWVIIFTGGEPILNFDLISLSGYKMDIGNCYLTPFVGTDIRNNPEKYNLNILYKDFEFHRLGFVEPICKPDEMTFSELSSLSSYTHNELLNFVKENIFKLDKEKIDKQVHFFSGNKEIPIFWSKTFYTLIQIRRYYMVFSQKTTIKGYELFEDDINEIKNCIPIRLWDINYKLENDSYYFRSLKGEIMEICEKNKEFWELASGKIMQSFI